MLSRLTRRRLRGGEAEGTIRTTAGRLTRITAARITEATTMGAPITQALITGAHTITRAAQDGMADIGERGVTIALATTPRTTIRHRIIMGAITPLRRIITGAITLRATITGHSPSVLGLRPFFMDKGQT